VYYPADLLPEYPRQHSYLATLLAKRATEPVREFLQAASASARDAGCHTVLLSGEDFCVLPAHLVDRFRELVAAIFEPYCFVILVRNKRDFVMSSYLQHLRYARPPITEQTFLQRFRFSPRDSIATWKAYFSPNGQVLLYDQVKHDLIREFCDRVLNIDCKAKVVSNESLDYLSASLYNMLLKRYPSPELDKIFWRRKKLVAGHFPIEDALAEGLDNAYADADWRFPEAGAGQQMLLERHDRRPEADPVEVCDSMLELFALLKSYFQKQRASANEEPAKD